MCPDDSCVTPRTMRSEKTWQNACVGTPKIVWERPIVVGRDAPMGRARAPTGLALALALALGRACDTRHTTCDVRRATCDVPHNTHHVTTTTTTTTTATATQQRRQLVVDPPRIDFRSGRPAVHPRSDVSRRQLRHPQNDAVRKDLAKRVRRNPKDRVGTTDRGRKGRPNGSGARTNGVGVGVGVGVGTCMRHTTHDVRRATCDVPHNTHHVTTTTTTTTRNSRWCSGTNREWWLPKKKHPENYETLVVEAECFPRATIRQAW
mmetsp:Transcript_12449/g.26249  ORF Transcript_12449/g.26249 Transcript_12449/m.26249 type:complete len:263 (-) Transcript_12449:80-868(-)